MAEPRHTSVEPIRDADLRLDAYLPYRLSTAANAVSGLIGRAFRDRFDLTIPQWRLISVLAEDGPTAAARLAPRTGMEKATVSRAARELARRDLVSRGDVLALTPSGSSLYGEIAPLALAYEAALIAGLAPDEVKLLKRLLCRLQGAADQLSGGPA